MFECFLCGYECKDEEAHRVQLGNEVKDVCDECFVNAKTIIENESEDKLSDYIFTEWIPTDEHYELSELVFAIDLESYMFANNGYTEKKQFMDKVKEDFGLDFYPCISVSDKENLIKFLNKCLSQLESL